MIFGNIHSESFYRGMNPDIDRVFDYMKDHDISALQIGRHEIGNGIFVQISEYITKSASEAMWEAHRKYVDVQYIIRGTEMMGHTKISGLIPRIDYDAENDIEFLSGMGDFLTAEAGDFVVFHPHDVHMPGISPPNSSPAYVRKAVFKIPVR